MSNLADAVATTLERGWAAYMRKAPAGRRKLIEAENSAYAHRDAADPAAAMVDIGGRRFGVRCDPRRDARGYAGFAYRYTVDGRRTSRLRAFKLATELEPLSAADQQDADQQDADQGQ